MTVVQPNGISGVTSVTSSTDVIEFYSSDYSSLAALNVNINSNSGVSTFNNVQVGNGSSLLVGVSTFSVGTAGSVGVGSAIPDKDFVVSGESRFKDWINGDANSKIHIAGNIVIPATYKIYVDGGSKGSRRRRTGRRIRRPLQGLRPRVRPSPRRLPGLRSFAAR